MSETPKKLLEQYYARKKSMGYSQQTIDRVVLNTSMYIRDMRIRSFSQITTKSVLRWGEIKLETISRSTLYTYYNSIRSYINFIRQMGIEVDVDETQVKCRPHYKSRTWLRPAQIKQIVRCAEYPADTLIRLMYTTGMRISEAISINERDLMGDTTLYIKSKGGNMRPIFLTRDLYDELEQLSAENGGFCFIDPEGEPLTRKKAYHVVKKAMILAGYPNAYPHALRHSFATELLRKGVSLSHTQRLMGHANVSITQLYEHLITDDIEKAHAKLTRV